MDGLINGFDFGKSFATRLNYFSTLFHLVLQYFTEYSELFNHSHLLNGVFNEGNAGEWCGV